MKTGKYVHVTVNDLDHEFDSQIGEYLSGEGWVDVYPCEMADHLHEKALLKHREQLEGSIISLMDTCYSDI